MFRMLLITSPLFGSTKQFVIISTLLAIPLMIANADYWNRSIFNGTETVDKKHEVLKCGLLKCALRCSKQHGCNYFFYSNDGYCYVVSASFPNIGFKTLAGLSKYEYIPRGCPLMFKYLNGFCFYVVEDPTDKLMSTKANPFCQKYGGQLMVIDSQEKHNTIVNYLIPGNYYLFGIYNSLPNGSFDTTDGRSSDDLPYTNWYPGEPTGPFDEPNYGIIRSHGNCNFSWNTSKKMTRYFICEKYILHE